MTYYLTADCIDAALSPEREADAIIARTIETFADPIHAERERELRSLEVIEATRLRAVVIALEQQLAKAKAEHDAACRRITELRSPVWSWQREVDRLRKLVAAAIEGTGMRYLASPDHADGEAGRVLDQHGNDLRPDWRFR